MDKYNIDEILGQLEPDSMERYHEYEYESSVDEDFRNHAYLFNELPEELRNDRDFVLKAVEVNGAIYEYLSDELKKDEEIAIISINSYFESFRHLPDELFDNERVVEAAIENNQFGAEVLEYASERLKDNKDIVMHAVSKSTGVELFSEDRPEEGYTYNDALCYASERLRDDTDVVLLSVENNPDSLKSASARLQNDYDVVLTAVKGNAHSLKYASEELRNNKDLVLIAANSYFNSLYDYYDQGLGGEELEGSVNIEDSILEYISDELKNDRDVILAIVNNNPYAFVNIPDKYKDDYDIALIAFKEDECLIETASEMVKKLLKNQ